MKRLMLLLPALFAAFALALGALASEGANAAGVLDGKIVCIDPGHGGSELGAVYQKKGRGGWELREKDVNLDVAFKLRELLEQRGATVAMTRTDDSTLSLQARVDICNNYRQAGKAPDILVSVHTNSTYTSRWDGSTTLMNKAIDRQLAEALQPVIYSGLKSGWTGRFTDYGINVDTWYVPLHANMPAVILEPVFMSNDAEADALRYSIAQAPNGRRAQISQVEFEGILAFFSP